MEMLLYLVPVFGILGLLFAAYLAARVGRQDAGKRQNERNRRSDQ